MRKRIFTHKRNIYVTAFKTANAQTLKNNQIQEDTNCCCVCVCVTSWNSNETAATARRWVVLTSLITYIIISRYIFFYTHTHILYIIYISLRFSSFQHWRKRTKKRSNEYFSMRKYTKICIRVVYSKRKWYAAEAFIFYRALLMCKLTQPASVLIITKRINFQSRLNIIRDQLIQSPLN